MANNKWDLVISSKYKWYNLNLKELFKYIDLIILLVKRDFVVFYKQTILGPLWYILQQVINTIIFTIIFGKIANIPTDGLPPFLFYMSGNIIWLYFATCLNLTSATFASNSKIFGKVYFPRLVVPISYILISLVQFFLQFSIFILFLIYYNFNGVNLNFTYYSFIFLPLIILLTAFLSIGFGIFLSSLTTKYRDLTFVLNFGIQLWMFATPIVYPLSLVSEKYKIFFYFNPMTFVVESFRGVFFGLDSISILSLIISFSMGILVFFIGIILFNKVEKNFMDTI